MLGGPSEHLLCVRRGERVVSVQGRAPTPQEEQNINAAADLAPDKSLARINELAKFVFAQVAIVGTLLAGLGLFGNASDPLRQGPKLIGVPITIALVTLALLLGIGALFPRLTIVRLSDPSAIQQFYSRAIRNRGVLAILSLIAFAMAIISATIIAMVDAVPRAKMPALSAQISGTGKSTKLTATVKIAGLADGSIARTSIIGARPKGTEVQLCKNVSRVDNSGKASVSCTVPVASRYRRFVIIATSREPSKPTQRAQLAVTP